MAACLAPPKDAFSTFRVDFFVDDTFNKKRGFCVKSAPTLNICRCDCWVPKSGWGDTCNFNQGRAHGRLSCKHIHSTPLTHVHIATIPIDPSLQAIGARPTLPPCPSAGLDMKTPHFHMICLQPECPRLQPEIVLLTACVTGVFESR